MSTDNKPDTKLQKLAEPFRFNDSNVTLRAGGVDFQIHKLVLSHASSIFKDMFSLPSDSSPSQEGSHVVEVTEDAQTIHDVLSLIYPNAHNIDLDDFHTLQRVLLAARKYSMDNLRAILAKTLEAKIHVNPVGVFAVACLAEAPQVARIAAKETLKWSYTEIINCNSPEVNRMRGGTLRKLLHYHNVCADLASQTIRKWATQCPVDHHKNAYAKTSTSSPVDCRQSWWNSYIDCVERQSTTRPIQPDYKSIEFMRVLSEDTHCYSKCSTATMRLIELADQLKQEVQQAISSVQLDLDDDDYLI
ncbi:hypothetical protein QCA50_004169 [Cerrena zonata]|uniref:BTB domain-containing protein n=1 Tax=Cerrena zonata TaxID=2478898 RepID=A0AAW0GN75_9APHY